MKKRVLILCTGNSCRSQMAEGFWRNLAGERWDVHSAGILPVGVNPTAIEMMAELGIDISGQKSQSIGEFIDQPFDLVVTVCGNVERVCPDFPGAAVREHWPFDDPVGMAGDEEGMRHFRRVRDAIGAKIRVWLESQG